ncbi:MAG: aminoacyl-histidine dipeptidase [Dysgonamonadaceae bacterium]|jgi:dipeptidase D|nr:aminoacyl-histidine dipeptidase [Dysgonamonadaceae bacterium]
MKVRDLEPALVWRFFDSITEIPRRSKMEDKMVAFMENFAAEHGLRIRKDGANNILITKPAATGLERVKPVILQSHLDMVCDDEEGLNFNFDTDPIKTYVKAGFVKARGTTLGADNGLGIAASLAVLASSDIVHGPLGCLFTTDEESGMTGAHDLDESFLSGYDILINLDNEKWGDFCIGCAGGKTVRGLFDYDEEPAAKGYHWFEVKVDGLKGGHSGCDIHLGRGNANKILVRYLRALRKECSVLLSNIDGGKNHNGISRHAVAVVGVPVSYRERATVLLNLLQSDLLKELSKPDPGVELTISTVNAPKTAIDGDTARRLLDTLYAIPHGVIGMSHDIKGLVETSTNLASIKMEGGVITVVTSQRSSTSSLLTDVCDMVISTFELGGAKVVEEDPYPSWRPDTDSEILKLCRSVFERQFGFTPVVSAVHAGLECGLFLRKHPRLDSISFGPTIIDAHSPSERVEIASVGKWWLFLKDLLRAIPAR